MYQDGKILVGKSGEECVYIYPSMANRHGLIAGATGTGKTVTLKVLAESFSDAGVPVFLADAKGDLSGMIAEGEQTESVVMRVEKLGLAELGFTQKSYSASFWDVYQENGIPLRTTISEMGPTLLASILGLNDTQSDIMNIIFKIADDEGLLLIDTKDLKSMLQYVGKNSDTYSQEYGNMAKQSLAAITRAVGSLESEGGELFFGEPALDLHDWLALDEDGRGRIQILNCQKLMLNPTMYATFMLWLISELFEMLPEAGDMDKPKLVFFFDEAHMLFQNMNKALLPKIEQLVKLIRSKGVGIYFITQNPKDIPDAVLAQLGNKVQHALRAYTPAEQKSVKAAAQSFRENPDFKTEEVIANLGIGEALISVLDEDGVPTIVKQCKILPPESKMGAVEDSVVADYIKQDAMTEKYSEMFDRDSAYEFLKRKGMEEEARIEEERLAAEKEKEKLQAQKELEQIKKQEEREELKRQKEEERERREYEKLKEKELREKEREKEQRRRAVSGEINRTTKNVASSVGRELGKQIGVKIGGSSGKSLGGSVGSSLARGLFSTLLNR